jgi:hypothetical protein
MKSLMYNRIVWLVLIVGLIGSVGWSAVLVGPAEAAAPEGDAECAPAAQATEGADKCGGMMSEGMMAQGADKGGMMGEGMMAQGADNGGMMGEGMMAKGADKGGMMSEGMMAQGADKGGMMSEGMMAKGADKGGMMGEGMMAQGGMMAQDVQHQHDMMSAGLETESLPEPWGKSYLVDPQRVLESFLADLNPELKGGTIVDFGKEYYAEAVEKTTGVGAYEVIINRNTGAVYPAKGVNVDWNLKYSTVGTAVTLQDEIADPPRSTISKAKAVEIAGQYLAEEQIELSLDDNARQFYGYYSLTALDAGKPVGILSVNGFNGRVVYRAWVSGVPSPKLDTGPAEPPADAGDSHNAHHPPEG